MKFKTVTIIIIIIIIVALFQICGYADKHGDLWMTSYIMSIKKRLLRITF